MRRWLTIFLLVLLPLQVSWAVAASYCQHEARTSGHFGHHEHRHQGGDSEAAISDKSGDSSFSEAAQKAKAPLGGLAADCEYCHFSFAKPLADAARVQALPLATRARLPAPLEPDSHIPQGLERPNWCALA